MFLRTREEATPPTARGRKRKLSEVEDNHSTKSDSTIQAHEDSLRNDDGMIDQVVFDDMDIDNEEGRRVRSKPLSDAELLRTRNPSGTSSPKMDNIFFLHALIMAHISTLLAAYSLRGHSTISQESSPRDKWGKDKESFQKMWWSG